MSAVTPFNPINIGVFQPNQIGGLALWLDAADANSITLSPGTQNVTGWNDKSGGGYNATAFGTGSPTYSSNSITFTGGQAFSTTLSSSLANQSGFAIVKYTSSAKIDILSLRELTGTAGGIQQIINANVQSITTYGGAVIATGATLTQNTMLLYNHTFSATTNAFLYINGSQTGTSTGPYTFTGTGTVNIGAYDINPLTNEGFIGSMYEILLFNVVLSTTQRQQIESYLAYKWNLQSSLPTTHPYYASPYNAIASLTNINQITKFAYPVLPNQIGGLALWLDAADSGTLFQNSAGTTPITASGQQIQYWKDKSTSSNNATTSGTVINYLPTGFNNLPTVNFPGTQTTGLSLSGSLLPNGTSDATYFFVIELTLATQIYFAQGGASGMKQFYANRSGGLEYLVADIGGNGLLVNGGVQVANSPIIVSITQSTLNFGWKNGTPWVTTGTGWSWNLQTTAAWIGSGGLDGTSLVCTCKISEIVIYNSVLTTTQRQQIEGYLAYKWNLQNSLPSTHPYYKNAFIPNMNQSVPTTITMYQYSPKSLSGLALWLDAADSSSVSLSPGTQNLTAWTNKVTNTTGAATINGTLIYRSRSGPNSLPTIDTGAGGIYMAPLTPLTNSVHTTFVIMNMTTTPTAGTPMISYAQSSGLAMRPLDYAFSTFRNLVRNPSTATATTPSFLNTFFMATSYVTTSVIGLLTNGGQTSAITSITTNPATITGFGVGYSYEAPSILFFGNISEVITYSRALSTSEIQQIEGYLAWKWSLVSSLPSSHPYKLYPP